MAMPSRAFTAIGTETFVDGKRLAEVRALRVVAAGVEAEANWIPDDETHRAVLFAIQNKRPITLSVKLPSDNGIFSIEGSIEGDARLVHNAAALLRFTVKGSIKYASVPRAS